MSNIKISQLPVKGANLAASDLLEVSEFTGTGYVSKSITGQEIIDAASGGGVDWGDITGTLSSQTDLQTALDAKQDDLVSGTNIKTINSTSLLGSGNVAVQPTLVSGTNIKTINGSSVLGSGDLTIGGGGGIYSLLPLASGQYTYNQAGGSNSSSIGAVANAIFLHPYIPAQSYTCSEVVLSVVTGVNGGLGRIGIYDQNNGLPNNLIYQSADFSCTSGNKVLLTNIDFVAGEVYWIACNFNTTGISIRQINTNALIPINTFIYEVSAKYSYRLAYAFNSGFPNPISGVTTWFTQTIPYLAMKKL